MDALQPTRALLVAGGPTQPCGLTWTTTLREPCRGISAAYCDAHSLDPCWVQYVAFWLPPDTMALTLGADLQPGTPQLRLPWQRALLAMQVVLTWPPFSRPTVLRHVPKVARAAWAQCFARALAAVAHHNSAEAWWDLLVLPKAVLRPAPRGGALRRQRAWQFTLRRCGRCLGGERDELLEAHARPRGRRFARAPDTLEDGAPSTAVAARWRLKASCPGPVQLWWRPLC